MSRRDAGGKHMAPDVEGQGILHKVKADKTPHPHSDPWDHRLPAGSPLEANQPNAIVHGCLHMIEERRHNPKGFAEPIHVDPATVGSRESRGLAFWGATFGQVARVSAGGAAPKCTAWLKTHTDLDLNGVANLLVTESALTLDMCASILACKIAGLSAVP